MPSLRQKRRIPLSAPQPGLAIYLRTSSDENQKPEMSRARQRFTIEKNVLERSDLPVYAEYVDVLTGKTAQREAYQRLLEDARQGKFSHVIVERADRFGRNDTEALRAIDELDEFGVAVRFANQPDLDPMDPDDRVIVTLSFTLARRESALLGIRVKGGLKAKRDSGGWCGRAPDGYRNIEGRTAIEVKKQLGRFNTWIEQDPERAPIWRYAWDLLLEDRMTLDEIAEALHARGYMWASGRPFVEVTSKGKRKPNKSTLSNTFHNWAYAGWVVSKSNNIPPKTVKGNWEPIVTTEEFERGLQILAHRSEHRIAKRKHDYLLKGMVYFQPYPTAQLIKLTGSTSNTWRSSGGTAYYCVPRSNVNLLCHVVEGQITDELMKVQVDPELIPLIRDCYMQELDQQIGYLRPDERQQLQLALKEVNEEEQRMARLFASGKITDETWDRLWTEWQDRRRVLRMNLDGLAQKQEVHIDNLDTALKIIANVGNLYNKLTRSDQKEILRQMVERVVINPEGKLRLELRAPFTYLQEIIHQVNGDISRMAKSGETKTSEGEPITGQCSDYVQESWGTWIRTKISGFRVHGSAVELSPIE